MDYKEKVIALLNSKELSKERKEKLESIFPELVESEEERIRKEIIEHIVWSFNFGNCAEEKMKRWIAWLEKQGEHAKFRDSIQVGDKVTRNQDGVLVNLSQLKRVAKPADKVEAKFKVGDWVVTSYGKVNQVVSVDEDDGDGYTLDDGTYFSGSWCDMYHLWTIQDAKDGDVLVDSCAGYKNPLIFILKKFEHKDFGLAEPSDYSSYCFLTMSNKQDFKEGFYHHMDNIHPATKEQRDLLFQKMHEEGYEWEADKKELKKIEQKPADTEKGAIGNEREIPFSEQKPVEKVDQHSLPVSDNSSLPTFDESIYHPCTEEVYEQKHAAWSEDDELHIKELESLVKRVWAIAEHENDKETIHKMSDLSFFLKTFKPQLKQEWSEEDNKHLESILIRLDDVIHNTFTDTCYSVNEDVDWLKSLRPHSRWKPSKEQMDMLAKVCSTLHLTSGENEIMESIYDALKKLMEK